MKRIFTFLGTTISVVLIFVSGAIAQGSWTRKTDFPGQGRYFAASFSIGNKAYIGIGNSKDFWEWDQATNAWTRKADYPGSASKEVVCFSIGIKGYIGTGSDSNSLPNEFWEYDPSADTWTQKASIPGIAGRSSAVGFSIGTKGYIGLGRSYQGEKYLQDFWEWDQATNTWTQKADFAGGAREKAIGFSIGNKGYIGTGYSQPMIYNDFWEWDQSTDEWTQKANLPIPRDNAVGFSIGNKGYIVIGGQPDLPPLNDFWEWDPVTNVWSKKTDYEGFGRVGAVGFSIGNKGYIGTGSDGKNRLTNDFWEYDPLGTQDTHTDIVPNGAVAKKLSSDQFYLTEGPVWYRDSVLLFTSDNQRKIYSYDPIANQIHVFRNNVGANGLTLDKNGNLLACESRVVMRGQTGAAIKLWPDSFNGRVFNSPNDLIADDKGGIYFTDPMFFATSIQDKDAVYYIDSTGVVKRVIDDLQKPNGVVLSPDGKKLYVADSNTTYVYSWEVASDGSVLNKTIFAELQTVNGLIIGGDGMAIDIYGNLYVATEMGIQIFSANGTAITIIKLPEGSLNCDFGGKDFKTLYITGINNLYSIDLNYEGYAVSRQGTTGARDPMVDDSVVEVFPNPVSGILHVHHNLGKLRSIDLLTVDGKTVSISLNIHDDEGFGFNTQSLSPGLYLLRLAHQQGITTKKFLKK